MRDSVPHVYDRFDTATLELPPDLRLTYIHDRADSLADIGEVRALPIAHEHPFLLTETTGFGHSRVLSADLTLDTVLAALESESLTELRG